MNSETFAESYSKDSVLESIGNGFDSLNKIAFDIEVDEDEVKRIAEILLEEKLIKIEDSILKLTQEGLVRIASAMSGSSDDEYEYTAPWFNYRNVLDKDVIFMPFLNFDDRFNYQDHEHVKLYKAELKIPATDIRILKVIEDFVVGGFSSVEGSWILKAERKICGLKVKNLLKVIEESKTYNFDVIITFSRGAYILIVKGSIEGNTIKDTTLYFYLSNIGETPYVDILNHLRQKLKIIMNFYEINELPKGKEVRVYSGRSSFLFDLDSVYRDMIFVPELYGKVFYYRNADKKEGILPLVIIINPKCVEGSYELKNIDPWIISSTGGFLEDDFKNKTKFKAHLVEQREFEEVVIVRLTVSPYSM